MDDLKALKKLAEVCRKAGIKHYKDGEVEFTLSDVVIEAKRSRAPRNSKSSVSQRSESLNDISNLGDLTEEQLLMWSSSPNIDPGSEGT